MNEVPVELPPLAEQQRIADKLNTVLARVDACRDRLARVAPLLKRFRQSVLAAATSGRLTEDWRAENDVSIDSPRLIATRTAAVESTRDSRLLDELVAAFPPTRRSSLPASWLSTCVGMAGVVTNGSTPSRSEPSFWNGTIPWVSSGEVKNARISSTRECITPEGYEKSSVRLLPAGTVMIAMIGEGKTRGQSAILDIEACINQNVAGVVPIHAVLDSNYLWYWFQGQYDTTRLQGNGTGPQALNCQRVRELALNLPPIQEQVQIVNRVESLFAFADRLDTRFTQAKAAADRLTPALLAKAFRGELVPQDPDDEPAVELLKRLAAQRQAVSVGRVRGRKFREDSV